MGSRRIESVLGRPSGSPRLERFASEDAERVAGCEMTLDIEVIVDGGVNGQKRWADGAPRCRYRGDGRAYLTHGSKSAAPRPPASLPPTPAVIWTEERSYCALDRALHRARSECWLRWVGPKSRSGGNLVWRSSRPATRLFRLVIGCDPASGSPGSCSPATALRTPVLRSQTEKKSEGRDQ
jgi:hypothetical protein